MESRRILLPLDLPPRTITTQTLPPPDVLVSHLELPDPEEKDGPPAVVNAGFLEILDVLANAYTQENKLRPRRRTADSPGSKLWIEADAPNSGKEKSTSGPVTRRARDGSTSALCLEEKKKKSSRRPARDHFPPMDEKLKSKKKSNREHAGTLEIQVPEIKVREGTGSNSVRPLRRVPSQSTSDIPLKRTEPNGNSSTNEVAAQLAQLSINTEESKNESNGGAYEDKAIDSPATRRLEKRSYEENHSDGESLETITMSLPETSEDSQSHTDNSDQSLMQVKLHDLLDPEDLGPINPVEAPLTHMEPYMQESLQQDSKCIMTLLLTLMLVAALDMIRF